MKVIVEFDYPTIEGMIYKDTKVKVEESNTTITFMILIPK
jgi:hypothetical protein